MYNIIKIYRSINTLLLFTKIYLKYFYSYLLATVEMCSGRNGNLIIFYILNFDWNEWTPQTHVLSLLSYKRTT